MSTRTRPRRNTKQRSAIRSVLAQGEHPMTVDELHAGAQKHVNRIGIATVYRAIRSLVDEGDIVPVEVPGEAVRYEASGKGHHHHFHCRTCGRVYEIHGCTRSIEVLAPAGFAVEAHDLILTGRCEQCRKRKVR